MILPLRLPLPVREGLARPPRRAWHPGVFIISLTHSQPTREIPISHHPIPRHLPSRISRPYTNKSLPPAAFATNKKHRLILGRDRRDVGRMRYTIRPTFRFPEAFLVPPRWK